MRWNSKTEDKKHLRKLLIFTSIPLNAQDVWSLNQLCVYVLERMMKSHPNIQTISYYKNYVSFSPHNSLSN